MSNNNEIKEEFSMASYILGQRDALEYALEMNATTRKALQNGIDLCNEKLKKYKTEE